MNPYGTPQGAQNLGMGGNAYGGSNPYLQQNIDSAMGDVTRQYQNTVAPQRAGAMAASGSFGNSGQQAMQLEDQRNLGQTLANTSNQMRSADYTQQQAMYQQDQQNRLAGRGQDLNYNLGLGQNANSRTSIDNNYNLGLRQNDLGFANLDANINNSNFSNQLAGANFGMNAYNTLTNNNNLGITAGTQMQQTPFNNYQNFSNTANAIGNGFSSSTQTNPGSPLTGALAGWQLGSAAFNQYNKPQGSL
jgi:hypothetical protein